MRSTAGWTPLTEPSRSVALELLLHGPLSRTELAQRLDLSRASLTRLSRPLVEGGLLVEGDHRHETPSGRPGRPLDVVSGAHHFVGVRLTHLEAVAVRCDLRATPVASASAPLPDLSPAAVVEVVTDLVRRLTPRGPEQPPVTALGVAFGGRSEAGRTVVRAPFLGWEQVPLADALEAATGVPTWVESDVVALTTAEHWFGAGRCRTDLAVVTVGTGVGCGLVIGDSVVNQPDGGVGLVGHLPLGLPGPLCERGHRGCAAAVLSDASLLAQACVGLRRPVSREELHRLVLQGSDPVAVQVGEDFAQGLGRLVHLVASISQVPLVVVAGEGVELAAVVEDRVRAVVADEREQAAAPLEISLEWAGTTQWARGAAAIAIQRYVSTGPA